MTTLDKSLRALAWAGFLTALGLTARAQSNVPFSGSATTQLPANNITVTASGSSFETFINSIISSEGQFQALDGKPFAGTATFLGVKDALIFQVNAAGTVVSFSLGPINFNKTFTAANSTDLSKQVTDFFKKDGAQTIADFLAAIAKQSTIAVTDGNPNAATAIAANNTFISQGFTPVEQTADAIEASSSTGGTATTTAAAPRRFGGLGIGLNAGHFKSGGFEGDNYDFSISGLNIGFGPNVRLVTPLYASYVKVSGAQIGGLGGGLALPITIRTITKESPWAWRVTPSVGIGGRVSVDLAGGAALWQAGLSSTFDVKVAPKLVLGFVNQITTHKSIEIKQGDFHFDPQIDQQILKNGLRLVAPLARRVVADFFVVDTRFLQAAAVKSFQTYGGSISLRATQSFNLTLGANYDTGTNFEAYSAGLSSAWHW
jgi:hypothetical protein